MRPGTHNAITDVEDVLVGHATRDEPGWLTGVSVVLPPPGTVGGVDVRGGGPGTRETDLLDPANAVDAVDAVVLAGGSAFGLAAADGVADAVWAAGRGWPVGPGPDERVPIVPSAIVFDLGRAGVWRHHPGPADGATAHAAASTGPVAQGSVGAGTGARAGGLRGGVGTASAVLDSGVTVGALVVVNAVGSPLARDGSLLGAAWGLGDELDGLPDPSPTALERHLAARRAEVEAQRAGRAEALRPGRATTLAVVATDAGLTKAACRRLATVAHDGMARALSPVHTAFDGDTVFSLATGARPAPEPLDLVELHDAAAGCVTRAIVHALLAADSVDRSADGGLAALSWRDALTTP
ncbi:P1 family peptidase [Arthrobacter sp. NEB 688]|uniref:P1 family peptidase n=1 Tax=Arthrobacter sp. NEB 688 TaxID=904039 RepID=UPI001566E944|nr:P1 family peptidase [Arthrobacter sp. NEB 688]QKE85703.1 P1 family peptidase [Arthrobacter sp. NEB 688]